MAITKTELATTQHIRSVLGDPEYIDIYEKIKNNPDVLIKQKILLSDYGLSLDDFDFSKRNNRFAIFINSDLMFSAGELRYIEDRNEFIISVDTNIKKDQFNELWALIRRNQDKIGIKRTKSKTPLNDKLLYAIFKARKRKLTYADIFKLYQNRQLPYYEKGSDNQYKSEDSLERYYRKYYKTK